MRELRDNPVVQGLVATAVIACLVAIGVGSWLIGHEAAYGSSNPGSPLPGLFEAAGAAVIALGIGILASAVVIWIALPRLHREHPASEESVDSGEERTVCEYCGATVATSRIDQHIAVLHQAI